MIQRSTYKVLVVDDEASHRYATARALQHAGYGTVEAATGAEALAQVPGADAVVLDVHLPDRDGFQICRELRARPETASLPVIHVSAVYVQPQDVRRGEESGSDGYLLSPVDPTRLARLLDLLLLGNELLGRGVQPSAPGLKEGDAVRARSGDCDVLATIEALSPNLDLATCSWYEGKALRVATFMLSELQAVPRTRH